MGISVSIARQMKQAAVAVAELVLTAGGIRIGSDDIRAVMGQHGRVYICTGHGTGDDRVLKACRHALANLRRATKGRAPTKVVLGITGPSDLLLKEVNRAVSVVEATLAPASEVTFGVAIDHKRHDRITIILFAGGLSL